MSCQNFRWGKKFPKIFIYLHYKKRTDRNWTKSIKLQLILVKKILSIQCNVIWLIDLWIYLKQDLSTWWKVQNETGEFEFLRSTRTKTSEIDIWEPFYESCWHDSYPRWHNPPIHSVGCRCKKTTEEVVIRKWALLIQFSSHSNNTIEAKL